MAFFSKVGNILKQTVSKQISNEVFASRPSLFQAIRCMSSSKLFVGGISYATDDNSLSEAFSKYGEVIEAKVILDRDTGRSRGFGFITYTSSEEASSAIQALDGQDLHGRRIRVNYANDRPRGGFGGVGYGAGGGGGYGAGGGYGGGAGGYGAGGGGYGAGGGGYNNYGGDFGGGNRGGGFDNFGGGGNSPSNYGGGAPSNYASSGGSEGFGDAGMGFGSGNQFAAQESGSTGGLDELFADDNTNADGNLNQDDSSEANYRDDDDDDGDFAKRA